MKTFEKLNFITYPTPMQEMVKLREVLKVKPRLYVKRDDLTEVGLGGNKNRKLDYIMAQARGMGADAVITRGAIQSNHCRQTAAYAAMLGMECHLVLNGERVKKQGNHLVCDIFGAKIHYEPVEAKCEALCEAVAAELTAKGKKPYFIPVGASTALGSLGYVDCVKELAEQSKAANVRFDHLFCATGSAGTQAGLELGARLHMPGCKVHGISVGRGSMEQSAKVAQCASEAASLLGLDLSFSPGDISVYDGYFGAGYAVTTKEGVEAIRLLGRTQAILLDTVYSGKAMSGMLDILGKGNLDDAEGVIFIHTGGSPALYNFAESF